MARFRLSTAGMIALLPSLASAAPWEVDTLLDDTGYVAQKVELVDINADGFVDLVFANSSGDASGSQANAQLNQVFINDGGNGFTADASVFREPDNAYVIKAGDIDQDGDPDLVVGVLQQRGRPAADGHGGAGLVGLRHRAGGLRQRLRPRRADRESEENCPDDCAPGETTANIGGSAPTGGSSDSTSDSGVDTQTPADVSDTSSNPGSSDMGPSCGCRSGGNPPWFWLGLVMLAARRRRALEPGHPAIRARQTDTCAAQDLQG